MNAIRLDIEEVRLNKAQKSINGLRDEIFKAHFEIRTESDVVWQYIEEKGLYKLSKSLEYLEREFESKIGKGVTENREKLS